MLLAVIAFINGVCGHTVSIRLTLSIKYIDLSLGGRVVDLPQLRPLDLAQDCLPGVPHLASPLPLLVVKIPMKVSSSNGLDICLMIKLYVQCTS